MISDLEIGWLAGLLEGEGYFGFNSSVGRPPRIELSMTDEDVVRRAAKLIEKIIGKPVNVLTVDQYVKINPEWQQQFKIGVNGDSARMVICLVIRLLGYRRRQRAWQVLNGYKVKKQRLDINSMVLTLKKKLA